MTSSNANDIDPSASFGIGLKVSSTESMLSWSNTYIENSEHFTDFVPFLKQLFTPDEIKSLLKNKLSQLATTQDNKTTDTTTSQSQSPSPSSSSIRSFFIHVAPIYDILPTDVMINILTFLKHDKNINVSHSGKNFLYSAFTGSNTSKKHDQQHWKYLPLLSKTFKNIMYENVSSLYGDYSMITHDEGMPITLSDEELRFHVHHLQSLCNIEFCPSLTTPVDNPILQALNVNWMNDLKDSWGDYHDGNGFELPLGSGLNAYDSSSIGINMSHKEKRAIKRAQFRRNYHITMDRCKFPWYMIKKWEIKCNDNKYNSYAKFGGDI